MAWTRTALAWLLAVIGMATTGTIAQTQFVLGALADIGADIALPERISMTLADLYGLAPLYAVFIAIGFGVAFLTGGLLLRRVRGPRMLVFAVAGAACMGLMLVLMEQVFFGVPLIAGARTAAGFCVQLILGAAWGCVFAVLTRAMR